MTPAGMEPPTFWFVAQQLNHCATAVNKYRNNFIFNLGEYILDTDHRNLREAERNKDYFA